MKIRIEVRAVSDAEYAKADRFEKLGMTYDVKEYVVDRFEVDYWYQAEKKVKAGIASGKYPLSACATFKL